MEIWINHLIWNVCSSACNTDSILLLCSISIYTVLSFTSPVCVRYLVRLMERERTAWGLSASRGRVARLPRWTCSVSTKPACDWLRPRPRGGNSANCEQLMFCCQAKLSWHTADIYWQHDVSQVWEGDSSLTRLVLLFELTDLFLDLQDGLRGKLATSLIAASPPDLKRHKRFCLFACWDILLMKPRVPKTHEYLLIKPN